MKFLTEICCAAWRPWGRDPTMGGWQGPKGVRYSVGHRAKFAVHHGVKFAVTQGLRMGSLKSPGENFLLVVNRDHSSKLLSYEKNHFCPNSLTHCNGWQATGRVVAPSKPCGHVRSSRRRWRWAQCSAQSAPPTFGRVVHTGACTRAWCPVYRLCERPQPGAVWSKLVSLPVVAARDQQWRVASDKSGLLSLLRQFG